MDEYAARLTLYRVGLRGEMGIGFVKGLSGDAGGGDSPLVFFSLFLFWFHFPF